MTVEPFIATKIAVRDLSSLINDLEKQVTETKTTEAIETLKSICYLQRGPHSPFPDICLTIFSSESHRKIISYTHYVLDLFAKEAPSVVKEKVCQLMISIINTNELSPLRILLAMRTLVAYQAGISPQNRFILQETTKQFLNPSKNTRFSRSIKWYQNKQTIEAAAHSDRIVAQMGAILLLLDEKWIASSSPIQSSLPFPFFKDALFATVASPHPITASQAILVLNTGFKPETSLEIATLVKNICSSYIKTKGNVGEPFFTVDAKLLQYLPTRSSLSDPLFRIRIIQLTVKIIRDLSQRFLKLQSTSTGPKNPLLDNISQMWQEFSSFIVDLAQDQVGIAGSGIIVTRQQENEEEKMEGALGGTLLQTLPQVIQFCDDLGRTPFSSSDHFEYSLFSPYLMSIRGVCGIPWDEKTRTKIPQIATTFVSFIQFIEHSQRKDTTSETEHVFIQPFSFALLRTCLILAQSISERLSIQICTQLLHPLLNFILLHMQHPSSHIRSIASQILVWILECTISSSLSETVTQATLLYFVDPEYLFRFVSTEIHASSPIFWAPLLNTILNRLKVTPSFVTTAWATVKQLFLLPTCTREKCHIILDAECSELVWSIFLQGCLHEPAHNKPLLISFLFERLDMNVLPDIHQAIYTFLGEFCWFLVDGIGTDEFHDGLSDTFYLDTIIAHLMEGATLSDWQTKVVCCQSLLSVALVAPMEIRTELYQMLQNIVNPDETLHPQLAVPMSVLQTVVKQSLSFHSNIIGDQVTAQSASPALLRTVYRTHTNLQKAIQIHIVARLSEDSKAGMKNLGKGILGSLQQSVIGLQYPLGLPSKPFIEAYHQLNGG
ncbi:hypothetical protein BLNAU_521 [Blattamonas nauphoetae]|uniref:Uncharacterized protein n=1 Tax=Blattamonas nauphoetae TaxID=2049346 RepID=A0ABQ9YLG6_9EUKA|nr:hypothetical protein BLNAU_521 [Blattamonas nauphoetae]